MEVDTEPQEVAEESDAVNHEVEQSEPDQEVEQEQEQVEQMVPLTALQKERRKRQEEEKARMRYEAENQFYREQMTRKEPEEPDYSLEEPLTKGDAKKLKEEAEESAFKKLQEQNQKDAEAEWVSNNPEAYEYVTDNLEQFLEQRPNMTSAIHGARNRYREAFELMQALSPRQKKQMQQKTAKKPAPGSPNSVPKAANVSQVMNLHEMSDDEFNAWRREKRRRR